MSKSIVDPGGAAARRRWLAMAGVVVILAGCQPTPASTAGPSAAASQAANASPGATAGASAGPSAGATAEPGPPTAAPSDAPIPTADLTEGFRYSDILKLQVNALAVRKAPKTSAPLLHEWDILHEPNPEDLGPVRLNKGDFVSVHLGPLRIGNRVWYLVWPAKDGVLHESEHGWYAEPPFDGSLVPGWSAASQGSDVYMTLHRHPTLDEIEGFLPLGVNAAGSGGVYVSDPQPRHDGFLFDWAAASPNDGTACSVKVSFVPSDPEAEPYVAIDTTTPNVKVGPVAGTFVNTGWLPVPDNSWTEFTVQVEGTCRWAVRLTPLHHD